MSSYIGVHVNRLEGGTIDSVQVKDSAGIELPISPDEYKRRGIKPPIEELPEATSLQAGKLIHTLKLVPEDADISEVFRLPAGTLTITAGQAIEQCKGQEPGIVVRVISSRNRLVFGPEIKPYTVVPKEAGK